MSSYVYCISNGTGIKIGKADNVKNRIAQLQTGSNCVLELVGVIECCNGKEALTVEKELHNKLQQYNTINEWFCVNFNSVTELDERFTYSEEVEPPYIKLYVESTNSYMHGLPTTTSDVLNELLQYVTYGTQEIMLNSTAKKRIAEVTGMSPRTLDNRLQELAKSGIIHRVATGTYLLNPYLFGKGDWKTISSLRNKNIHLQIIYDKNTGERKLKGYIQEDKTTTLPTIEAEQ